MQGEEDYVLGSKILTYVTEIGWKPWNDNGLARGTRKSQFIHCEEDFALRNSGGYVSKCKFLVSIQAQNHVPFYENKMLL